LGWQSGFDRTDILVNDKYRAVNDTAHLYFLNLKIITKILKFKILQQIIPAIQWNRQNVILFKETIPLSGLSPINYQLCKVNSNLKITTLTLTIS
jgi:hypothetical protein